MRKRVSVERRVARENLSRGSIGRSEKERFARRMDDCADVRKRESHWRERKEVGGVRMPRWRRKGSCVERLCR
jgi:hypothetical protein